MDAELAAILGRSPVESASLPRSAGDWPAVLPDHFSASSLTMWHRCREQFRFRYVEGRKEPPKGYQVWGSADSAAAEYNYAQKIESHEDVPVSEVEEAFVDAVDIYVDLLGGESEVDWDTSAKSSADVKDNGVKLAALYHEQVAPRILPVAAEQRFEILVPDIQVPVIGYPDVETDAVVIERKTASKKFPNNAPAGNYVAQVRIYQLARPKPVDFHVSTKTKLPAVYTPADVDGERLEVPYSAATNERTERWIQTTIRGILSDLETFGPDGPWPGSEALMNTPCGWCGFRTTGCPWWT